MPPLSDVTDADLAHAAGLGDSAALEELARRSWPRIRRWSLVEMGDASRADDAAQESMVALIRFIDRYDPARPFLPWLRTLVANTCRTHRRRLNREAGRHGTADDLPASNSIERSLDLDRAAAEALQAFGKLKPRERQVVELCDHQGLTPAEVATELEVPPGTIRSLLHRARTTLRVHLLRQSPELADLVRETR